MSRIPVPSTPSAVSFPGERPLSPSPLRNSTSMSVSMSSTNSNADIRRKQNKKDEAIRTKITSELSRKRTISTTGGPTMPTRKKYGGKTAAKGTVAALKPSPALTVPESITVADASQLCAAKRTDCVLVVDDDESLCGIFTAKDLAFRVTAEGLDPRTTQVHSIMTPSPMVTRDTTSATEALELMVKKGFRHLPVCNEDGNVVGLLDITKVFHEALAKVERGSAASQKLYSALESVQSELGSGVAANPQAAAMLAYVQALREKTALPDLTTVMDLHRPPATVTPRSTVRDAARLMKNNRTTAVCIMEGGNVPGQHARIAGIFTSKDIVLRVIAAGLDPGRCSVVRVMTPHPDVAHPTLSIHDALTKMHNGHYLNLPVVDDDGRLVSIVDVLKLTYATLEQMNTLTTEATGGQQEEGGPMWGRFFESIGGGDDEGSVMSGSNVRHDSVIDHSIHSGMERSPTSEVHPNDSASAVDDDAAYSEHPTGAMSSMSRPVDPPPVDDGTYVFKFRTPSGQTHRFQARHDNFENLRDIVLGKLGSDPFFSGEDAPDVHDFSLSYTDTDGDKVTISSDDDVTDAVKVARKGRTDRVVLALDAGKSWKKAPEKVEVTEPAEPVIKVDPSQIVGGMGDDTLYGVPRDLILPASLGFLAVAIIGVFTISRLSD